MTCCRRLSASLNATWDLIIIQSANESVTCPACLLTFASSALGRYQQLWQLTQSQEWKQLHADQYQYVYFLAGDIYHDAKQIDR